MNFKKLVCLTIAFAMAFAPVVGAQEDICSSCKSPKNVLVYTQEQAGCSPISYEYQNYLNLRDENGNRISQRWGYTGPSQNTTAKLIAKVCNCPNTATYFKMNNIIGIRLTILTDGVYWTDEDIAIQPFESEAAACAAGTGLPGGITVDSTDGVIGPALTAPAGGAAVAPDDIANPEELISDYPVITALPNVRYDADGDIVYPDDKNSHRRVFLPPVAIVEDAPIPSEGYERPYTWAPAGTVAGVPQWNGTPGHDFTPDMTGTKRTTSKVKYTYYKANGTTKVDRADVLAPRISLKDCVVPTDAQAKIVEVKGAYQVGYLDQRFNLSYWWIDIPQMVKNFSEIKAGDTLAIKVEFLWEAGAGVCAACRTICECIFTLGVFGDDVRTMYFPYVFTGISPWVTGLVVSNLDVGTTPITNMEATFSLYDSTGKEFTYKKTDFQASVWPFMLDSVVDKFDGTPKVGAGWMKVSTNFKVDGYQFVTDGVYGAGTLPRLPAYTAAPLD